VLAKRTVNTVGLGLDTDVCTVASVATGSGDGLPLLTYVPLKDSATANFALALGAFVQQANEQGFKQNYITPQWQRVFEGKRPNCLQANQGYKARPLNGIWATAPFLHNGSIATLYDLLSTEEERPVFVELGEQKFDAVHVAIVQGKSIKAFNQKQKNRPFKTVDDYKEGRFILDTGQSGNHNTGHLFDEQKGKSVTGRKLSEDEKMQLIAYLKTL
jgi:hypothetical protein